MNLRSHWLTFGVIVSISVLGCQNGQPPPGPPMAKPRPVQGRVLLKGREPLKGGVITFKPEEVQMGREVRYEGSSLVDGMGRFKIGFNLDGDGVAPGKYKVIVAPREINELRNSNSSRIPPVYRDAATTPLSLTVDERGNSFSLDLK